MNIVRERIVPFASLDEITANLRSFCAVLERNPHRSPNLMAAEAKVYNPDMKLVQVHYERLVADCNDYLVPMHKRLHGHHKMLNWYNYYVARTCVFRDGQHEDWDVVSSHIVRQFNSGFSVSLLRILSVWNEQQGYTIPSERSMELASRCQSGGGLLLKSDLVYNVDDGEGMRILEHSLDPR